jgi:hypothetical protein
MFSLIEVSEMKVQYSLYTFILGSPDLCAQVSETLHRKCRYQTNKWLSELQSEGGKLWMTGMIIQRQACHTLDHLLVCNLGVKCELSSLQKDGGFNHFIEIVIENKEDPVHVVKLRVI